ICTFSVFFFQAEDGIRDFHVTGVQTCALPICLPVHVIESLSKLERERRSLRSELGREPTPSELAKALDMSVDKVELLLDASRQRSEERRVGKEGGARRATWR